MEDEAGVLQITQFGAFLDTEMMIFEGTIALRFDTEDGLQATASYEDGLLILDFGSVVISYTMM